MSRAAPAIGGGAVLPDVFGILREVGQHLQEVLLHLGFAYEIGGDDSFGGGADLVFRAAGDEGRVGLFVAFGQEDEPEVVVGDAAAAVAPGHFGCDFNRRGFREGEADGLFFPRGGGHDALAAGLAGEGGAAEARAPCVYADEGGGGGVVGGIGFYLEGEFVVAGGQGFAGGLPQGGGFRAPSVALVEGEASVGRGGLAEVVVREAVGAEEEGDSGGGRGPTGGGNVPSAQAVGRIRYFVCGLGGTFSAVCLERGVFQIVCRDVGLGLQPATAEGEQAEGCRGGLFPVGDRGNHGRSFWIRYLIS